MPTSSRSGFAFPLVLLTIVLLTVGLVAVFTLVGSDRRGSDNQKAQLKAFELAQSGLEQFLGKRESLQVWVPDSAKWKLGASMVPPARAESLRVTVAGGYADVTLRRIRANNGNTPGLYVVRSRGVSTMQRLSGTPQGERTVAQYAYWNTNPIKVLAGWTSLSGLAKNGASGTLTGDDGCGMQPDVAGVAVPNNPGYSGPTSPVSGNPPILNMGTQTQANNSVGIDWPGIINQNAVPADVTIPPQGWPSFADPNYWPIIRVNMANFTLPNAGRGILIVSGNLNIDGSDMWSGVIMVGGTLTSNGNNTVEGAVISGLNATLGIAVPQNAVGNGNKTYQYNSCNVQKAGARFATLRTFPNAWLDNWSTY